MDDQATLHIICILFGCIVFSALQIFALKLACLHSMEELRRMQRRHRAEARRRRLLRRKIIRAACAILKRQRNSPRVWKKPRLGMWFETEVMNWWEDDRWVENFRMTKTSFHKLCNLVKDKMTPKLHAVRKPIPLEARLATRLYHLASSSEYRVTSNPFGHSKTSLSTYLYVFTDVM